MGKQARVAASSLLCSGALALILGVQATAAGATNIAGTPPPAAATAAGHVALPTDVIPRTYRIEIAPDAAARSFSGTVEIDISVLRPAARIVLNSADIVIDQAALAGDPAVPAVAYDEGNETASLDFGHPVAPGEHTLRIGYHGTIFQRAAGLFSLDYATRDGSPARALFTQFENSDARRFVPCWDEPDRKAVFELSAVVPATQVALSNMPVAGSQALPGGRQRVRFAATPRMSSYLLFFGLGDFERVHRTVDGVDVGVVVKRGDSANAAYALDAAAAILPYYNDYFGTPYPLPKLDMIAGPGTSQFFSAMENWGAIFYFERALLVDARVSTDADRQRIYSVVAHEMAHQWFGDLVTMNWWDGIWLNEGFASWMQEKVSAHFHPEWKPWLQAQRRIQGAMGEDAREGTHPIITPIRDVLQASGAFDDITYVKGQAVIRTLESYLGEEAFRAGVRRYMHDHAYGNTVTDDLWRAIDRGSRQPIAQIAHELTLQAGVPMVTEREVECRDGNTVVTLTQGRYEIDREAAPARSWHVPVRLQIPGGTPVQKVVSGAAPERVALQGCGPVVLNAGQTAYFRSQYSPQGLADLAAHFAALAPEDQLGILSDTASLAYIGQAPMAMLLDLTRRLPADADPVVAIALVERLMGLDRLYDGLPTQAAFRAFARRVVRPFFARTGWAAAPGESDNTTILRGILLGALGQFDDPDVLAEARRRFQRYAADPSTLDAETRNSVLEIVAPHADAATWEQLHEMARKASTNLERQQLYALLASTRDPQLLQRVLDLSLSEEPPKTVRPNLLRVASRRHPAEVFAFVLANREHVSDMLEPTSRSRFVPRLLASAGDTVLIDKLQAFADAYIPASARDDVVKTVASIRYNASIRQERLPQVDRWLATQGG